MLSVVVHTGLAAAAAADTDPLSLLLSCHLYIVNDTLWFSGDGAHGIVGDPQIYSMRFSVAS